MAEYKLYEGLKEIMTKTCPHCNVKFSLNGIRSEQITIDIFKNENRVLTAHNCPECKGPVIWLSTWTKPGISQIKFADLNPENIVLLFPKFPKKVIHEDIPEMYASEYNEAYNLLLISPKASAAISRRCLQKFINEVKGIINGNLLSEIDALIKLNELPVYLSKDLHAIREVGNFAAHPRKDINTGEIIGVEASEAEWIMDVLEDILLFYFVGLKKSENNRKALDNKLKASGKKTIFGH